MSSPVLVFGPTGAVGRAAAIEAHKRGAKVYLAMRDTSKKLQGIEDEENKDSYIRIRADLSKADTLKSAVETSGAKSAFVYVVHETQDSMRSSFEALKSAGVSYVVLLSTVKVTDPPSSEDNQKDFIGASHARAEIALQESGIAYTAVRPGYFTSNLFWGCDDIKKGQIELLYPDAVLDNIAPADIGAVCGALLSEPRLRQEAGRSIYLCGPKLLTQRETYGVIAKTLGRDIKVKEIDEQTWFKKLEHMPRPILDSLASGLRESSEGKSLYSGLYEEAVENIRRYAGREPTKLEEWVAENRAAFS